MVFPVRALVCAAVLCVAVAPAHAQQALDLSKFDAACLANGTMLTGPLPPEVEPASVLGPLCGCISGQLASFTQADIDMLAKDLGGEATDVDRAAYGDYDGLVARAGSAVNACLYDPRVLGAPPAQ